MITDYLDSRLIAFLDVETCEEAINALIERLDRIGKLPDREAFRKAIFDREKLVSTGIGMGVALPHAKFKGFPEFFIAIGIVAKPNEKSMKGIDWKALDGAPVRLIFMIGGPDDKQTQYLQLLSQLTSAIRDPEFRKKLLHAQTIEEVLALFEE